MDAEYVHYDCESSRVLLCNILTDNVNGRRFAGSRLVVDN
jgi:hypothetical protein